MVYNLFNTLLNSVYILVNLGNHLPILFTTQDYNIGDNWESTLHLCNFSLLTNFHKYYCYYYYHDPFIESNMVEGIILEGTT